MSLLKLCPKEIIIIKSHSVKRERERGIDREILNYIAEQNYLKKRLHNLANFSPKKGIKQWQVG
jgi:predicted SPOUT superfamily RNA methylase MTH1